MADEEANRKTNIPVKDLPRITEWLLNNCVEEEIRFMAGLARDRTKYKILASIINRLIEYNISLVFYSKVHDEKELMLFRETKLGEVEGLKAFALACKAANRELERRLKEKGD